MDLVDGLIDVAPAVDSASTPSSRRPRPAASCPTARWCSPPPRAACTSRLWRRSNRATRLGSPTRSPGADGRLLLVTVDGCLPGLAQALRELGEPLPADFHRLADDLERHLRGGDAPGS